MIKNTVQVRIIIIISTILLFFTAAIVYMKISFNAHINQIISGEASHQLKVLTRILDIQKSSIDNYIFDYTYWDEMVEIVEKRDYNAAKLNIDPSMESYNVQAVWVYDSSLNLVYFAGDDSCNSNLGILNNYFNLHDVIQDTTFRHFFHYYDCGLLEFSMAPIQPSADLTRQTPARGYYIAARLWDKNYLQQLSGMTDSYMEINTDSCCALSYKFEKQTGSIIINFPICSWDGDTICYLESTDHKDFISYFVRSANSLFIMAAIAILFIFGVVTFLISNWFGKPLTRISKSLKEQNTFYIDSLKVENNEFGGIATMLIQSFEQKAALEAEVAMRTAAESALRESEEKLRSIIETSPVIFWSMSTDANKIYYLSRAIEVMTGYNISEIGTAYDKWAELILNSECISIFQSNLSELHAKKESVGFECEFRHQSGRNKIASVILTPALNDKGEISRIDGLAIDVTERVELVNKIMQSEKMAAVGLLAAGVAHEFNNMLCAIRGNIELLSGRCPICGSCEENIKDATHACDRASSLVDSLLSYSRADNQGQGNVDINHIIKSTIKLTEKEIERAKIELHLNLDDIPMVRGIPGQIQQVLFNIIRNAIQAIDHDGKISINSYSDNHNIYIQIIDNGAGIDPRDLPRIFDPFFSTKGAWGKNKSSGTGLGLSISRNIIRNHHGDISASVSENNGTIFTIHLPITEPVAITSQGSTKISGAKVLLYEFDLLQANNFNEIITSAGGTTSIAAWSDEAIDLITKNPHNCVIIDLSNPAMGDMVRLFDFLSSNMPKMQVIIISEKAIKYQFMEYTKTAKAILTKPIAPTDFVKAIQGCQTSNQDTAKA
jgi:PAS domain S-box-containing protein